MSVNVNDKSGLVDSHTPGYSACGCGNRRYYTKAEIDEMLKGVLDPDEIEAILNQMFEEYIEGGELEQLIIDAIAGLYTNEEIDDMLEELEARMKTWTGNQGYLKDITLTINGTRLHNNDSIVIEGGDVSNKLDITAFTQAMQNETARTESTYAKKSEIPSLEGYATQDWVEDQDYLKDITLTINGTPLHNNGEIIIEGGGGEPVDISGKLDTSAFTAYTASTETWENNMEDCCDDVNGMIEYLLGKISDLEEAIDEITGSTPTPPGPDTGDTGDTPSSEMVEAVYRVTSTNGTKILNNNNYQFDYYIHNGQTYQLQATNDEVYHTFAATGEQSVSFHRKDKSIGKFQFYNTPLVRITLPDDTTVVGSKAFNTTLLTGITLPDSVTSVGMESLAFSISSESRNIEIHFGSGVESIGSYVNPKSEGVQNIYFTSLTPPVYSGNSKLFFTSRYSTLNIYVPSASVQAYKTAPGFSLVADRIQAWNG